MDHMNKEELDSLKDRYYHRNFISLLLEAFTFQFAVTTFSVETVLPVYLSEISSNPLYISLASLIYYSLHYVCAFFACVVGANAKSPKWVSVKVCFLQRIAFLFFFISTFFTKNISTALLMFYISLVISSITSGMSSPLWTEMVANVINRNFGTFFGAYNMVGSISGVIASLVFSSLLKSNVFPYNYRYLFLIGVITACIATMVISFGVREVPDPERLNKPNKPDIKSVINKIKEIITQNRRFQKYLIVRVVLTSLEFAIPYYIVQAKNMPGAPLTFAGILTTAYLMAKIIGSFILGKVSDRFGLYSLIKLTSLGGLIASIMALIVKDYRLALLMYFIVGFTAEGIYVSNSVGVVDCSGGKETTYYSAASGLISAPVSLIMPIIGSFIISKTSLLTVFILAGSIFVVALLLSLRFDADQSEN